MDTMHISNSNHGTALRMSCLSIPPRCVYLDDIVVRKFLKLMTRILADIRPG